MPKRGKVKTWTYNYPESGYNLICFDGYMYVGDLTGNLPIEPRNFKFGTHLLIAGKSNVIQIGDERGHALWTMLKLKGGFSLLYLGIMKTKNGEMLIFETLINNQPRDYPRNLFGDIGDMPYKNIYVGFNIINENELHITTRNLAPRCFKPTVVFAENI